MITYRNNKIHTTNTILNTKHNEIQYGEKNNTKHTILKHASTKHTTTNKTHNKQKLNTQD